MTLVPSTQAATWSAPWTLGWRLQSIFGRSVRPRTAQKAINTKAPYFSNTAIVWWPDTATRIEVTTTTSTATPFSRLPCGRPASRASWPIAWAAITQSTANHPTARNRVKKAPPYAPRTPNVCRDAITWVVPKRGPATLSRPCRMAASTEPTATATMASPTPRPNVTSSPPVISETKFATAATHSQAPSRDDPLRSLGGMGSIPRVSTLRNASVGALCSTTCWSTVLICPSAGITQIRFEGLVERSTSQRSKRTPLLEYSYQ